MNIHQPIRCDIYKIARQCGVRLYNAEKHSPTSRKPGDCHCKPTVRDIGRQHGEEHLKLVLMLVTGTKANAMALYADVLKSVSEVIANNPDVVRSATLTDDFNAIDLGELRRRALAARVSVPRHYIIQVWLYGLILPGKGE